jgi:hypothetical protein
MRSVLASAGLAAIIVACGGDNRSGIAAGAGDGGAPAAAGHERHRSAVTMTATPDSVTAMLDGPPSVRAGVPVMFVLHIRNESAQTAALYLRGREIAFDLVVTDSAGREIWTRLHDQIIPAIVRVEQLAPGASLELRDTWYQNDNNGQPVVPGEYVVQGLVLTDGVPMRTLERRLRIVP